jgi:tRNA A37 threonylcarbamoyladenosine dehydratase
MSIFERTELVLGADALEKLKNARVAVFGVGGVGGYVVEALARCGVGALDIFDKDTVAESNINRQIIALHSTVGLYKTDVMKARINDINPDCAVTAHRVFYTPDNAGGFDFSVYAHIVDAVDMVSAKIEIIVRAKAAGVPVISCMGTGNKLDPARLEVADIYKTSVCPLARVMRAELKKRGVEGVKVVYSREEPKKTGQRTPGSVSFVPPVAGFIIAGEVIKDLIK